MTMDGEDQVLVKKLDELVKGGLSESSAIQFLAILSISEYDRLIEIFNDTDKTGLPELTRKKLVMILEKLRLAKGGR
jgi:uncharacterized protein YoaH (UPF0181 family)